MTQFKYPTVLKDESVVNKIHGVDVPDPFRRFEDPDSEETKLFVEQQNNVTFPYLEQCLHRTKIKEILTNNQNYTKYGCPFKRGNKYYYFKNSGLQHQAVLYQMSLDQSETKEFLDPNILSQDGTTALSSSAFSHDGKYFAYGLSRKGSDWVEIQVKDVDTGKDLDEVLNHAKFTTIAWTHDNKGFFYAMYPVSTGEAEGTNTAVDQNHSIYYHLLNTPQSQDVLKVNFPDNPNWNIGFEVSQDGNYLHVYPRSGCSDNSWYYCELDNFKAEDKLVLKLIYEKMEADFNYIANNGKEVYFRTNLDAKNYRLSKLHLDNPSKEHWVDVIPNHHTDVLNGAEVYTVNGKDYMLVDFTRKVVSVLELRELEAKVLKTFDLPPGTVDKVAGRRDDGEIFFKFSSFVTPGRTYHFKLDDLSKNPQLLRESKPDNYSPDDYKIEQIFYKSKDGTEVPMFIVSSKDLVKNGSHPCILYGYGGFNIQITPVFNPSRLVWLKNFGGILAVANIRGGGEFGQNWHDSGRKLNKQNCFDDFVSAAEYLISNSYTSKNKLAIQGGSNGGLLVAAVSNQRPDLFGAMICQVGVLDMIRFSKFTIGHAWTSDYGNPDEKVHFDNLIKFSPYHNIPDNTIVYPASLLLTADHDDRVVPAHSLKFIAQLQNKLGSKLPEIPLMIRVDTKAGHGAGKPTSKLIEEYTDVYSFLYNALDLQSNLKV